MAEPLVSPNHPLLPEALYLSVPTRISGAETVGILLAPPIYKSMTKSALAK